LLASVSGGQVLAQLDNIEAGEFIAQYNAARSERQRLTIQLAAQQRQVERNRRLAEIGASPQKDYEFSLADVATKTQPFSGLSQDPQTEPEVRTRQPTSAPPHPHQFTAGRQLGLSKTPLFAIAHQ
jgi:hypothetical protein